MKNQYFGDLGDFGKYLLLRHLADAGITVGVNWYLTEDDTSNDGRMTDYLKTKEHVFRHLDEELFDALKDMVITRNKRDVIASEDMNLIRNAVYYHELLDISRIRNLGDKKAVRIEWHQNALKALGSAELIYFDPDNGIADNKVSGRKNSVKYLLTSEAADYYKAGHNLVYYCHKGRRKESAWGDYKRILCKGNQSEAFPDAKLICLTYHRGVQRSFIFAIHPKDYGRYRKCIEQFLTDGHERHYSEETID